MHDELDCNGKGDDRCTRLVKDECGELRRRWVVTIPASGDIF